MREFSVEEKYIIDEEIKNLSKEQKKYFKMNYKKVKSEYAFTALTVVLGFFAAPFFYIGFKKVTTIDIILFLVYFFGVIGLIIISIIPYIGTFIQVFMIFFEFLMMWAVYVRNSSKFKSVIDNYNYAEKVVILKTLIQG